MIEPSIPLSKFYPLFPRLLVPVQFFLVQNIVQLCSELFVKFDESPIVSSIQAPLDPSYPCQQSLLVLKNIAKNRFVPPFEVLCQSLAILLQVFSPVPTFFDLIHEISMREPRRLKSEGSNFVACRGRRRVKKDWAVIRPDPREMRHCSFGETIFPIQITQSSVQSRSLESLFIMPPCPSEFLSREANVDQFFLINPINEVSTFLQREVAIKADFLFRFDRIEVSQNQPWTIEIQVIGSKGFPKLFRRWLFGLPYTNVMNQDAKSPSFTLRHTNRGCVEMTSITTLSSQKIQNPPLKPKVSILNQ